MPALLFATRQMDLGVLADEEIFQGRHLVTASALLDLVSVEWLRALAHHCAAHHCAALFALSYNGESHAVPREPEDDDIRALMNRHQLTDKGFAPAAGPDASAAAAHAFEAVGYQVQRERTNWMLGPEFPELQRQLIEGWAHAGGRDRTGEDRAGPRLAGAAARALASGALADRRRSRRSGCVPPVGSAFSRPDPGRHHGSSA